jgi:hypothetical protein
VKIDVVVVVVLLFRGVSVLLLYLRGRGYKKSLRVGYNYSPSITISLVFSNYMT